MFQLRIDIELQLAYLKLLADKEAYEFLRQNFGQHPSSSTKFVSWASSDVHLEKQFEVFYNHTPKSEKKL